MEGVHSFFLIRLLAAAREQNGRGSDSGGRQNLGEDP